MIKIEIEEPTSPWELRNGKLVAVRIGSRIFRDNGECVVGNVKQHYFCKWIVNKKIVQFYLKDFFKEHPRYKSGQYRTKLNLLLDDMCSDNRLSQMGNDGYRVNKGNW